MQRPTSQRAATQTKEVIFLDNAHQPIACSNSKLGCGSYGEITKCDHRKVLKTEHSSSSTEFERELEFIQRTSALTTASSSPWVQMYRIATIDKSKLGMDMVDHTFKDLRFPIADISAYAHRIIRAVKEFHKRSLYTHNDLKPENIGIMNDGVVKLIDLGSVVHKDSPFVQVPQTPLYVPMLDGDLDKHEVRVLGDYWAVGCSLFELVIATQHETLRRSMGRHLFFRDDVDNFRMDMSYGLMLFISPKDLRYVLGLSNTYDANRIAVEYLERKRTLFGAHPLGKRIYALMCPCFDAEKFDASNPGCPTDEETHLNAPPASQFEVVEPNCEVTAKQKPFVMSQYIDRNAIKQMKAFLKTLPPNYKWGDAVPVSGGNKPSVPNDLRINQATLREIKKLIQKYESKKNN